ncbi:MAG TPA: ATP-binding cassette domain-containing protein [Acidimicrobiales bacterium]|nr:ATP-binding cassette domain-containing protein [Acidimicrobiales bacterium]
MTAATLEVRGLTVRFGPVEAVTDIDLDLRAGVVSGLIGPNGAGKTTVIDALTGLVPAASGRISLAGEAIERLPVHARARLGLARTFQSLELFEDLTVGENLLVAADAAGGGADWAGDLGALGGAVDLLPSQLSNAQRRLVALTRAVAGRPTVLLLDEPAAGLDPSGRQALGRRLRRLADDGAAVLLVDHDLGLVLDVCDEVTVLDRGRVIATGPPASLRADPRVRTAYLGREPAGGSSLAPAADPPALAIPDGAGSQPVLEVHGLAAGYGGTDVVHSVDLTVGPGEVVALLGRNGAGKTTTVSALTGARPRSAGEVRVAGVSLRSGRPHAAARSGIACVPQERSLFTQLSVAENLRLAVDGGRRAHAVETARAVERFPALSELLGRRVGLLSGGEQRMVAVARALARHPRVLLVDEMTLGLAPRVVADLVEVLRAVAEDGTGVLVVEQHLDVALALADRAYVMDRGRIVAEGPSSEIAVDPGPLTL